jgi:hypothetical protein
MTDIKELYENETGNSFADFRFEFYPTGYMKWLEQKAERAHRDSNEAAEAIFSEGVNRIMAEKKNARLLATINDYLSGNICKKSFRENIKKLTATGGTQKAPENSHFEGTKNDSI